MTFLYVPAPAPSCPRRRGPDGRAAWRSGRTRDGATGRLAAGRRHGAGGAGGARLRQAVRARARPGEHRPRVPDRRRGDRGPLRPGALPRGVDRDRAGLQLLFPAAALHLRGVRPQARRRAGLLHHRGGDHQQPRGPGAAARAEARSRAETNEALFAFSRDIADAQAGDDLLGATVARMAKLLGRDVILLLRAPSGALETGAASQAGAARRTSSARPSSRPGATQPGPPAWTARSCASATASTFPCAPATA